MTILCYIPPRRFAAGGQVDKLMLFPAYCPTLTNLYTPSPEASIRSLGTFSEKKVKCTKYFPENY
jgi:hypothetical protein